MGAWREEEKRGAVGSLQKDFVDDCHGAKVLREAEGRVMLFVLWKGQRVGFAGAITQPTRRNGISCVLQRLYVSPEVRHHCG